MDRIRRRALLIEKGTFWPGLGYAALLFTAAAAGVIAALLGVLCAAYGPDAVFAGYPLYGSLAGFMPPVFFPAALFAAALLLAVFAAAFTAALRAVFFHAADKNQRRPSAFLSVREGVRTLACGLRAAATKRGLTLALSAPLQLTAGAFILLLKRVGLAPAVFYAGLAVCAAEAALTAAAAFLLGGRYLAAPYLLYLYPLLRPGAAVRAAARFSDGRLLLTARVRLLRLRWLTASLLLLPLPFALRRRGLTLAALCETLYGENKRRTQAPAVVFYIDGKSRFAEAEERKKT